MKNLITLDTPLSSVQSVVPKFLPKLKKLGLLTVRDLLWHFPTRYEDFATISKIKDLKVADQVTIKAEVRKTRLFRIQSKRLTVFEAIVNDESSGLTLVWFNQPFIANTIKEGVRANFAGKVFASPKGGLSISNPKFEIIKEDGLATHTAGLIAVYPETKGMTSKGIRFLIKTFLEILKINEDFLPKSTLKKYSLPSLREALEGIHFPKNKTQIQLAQKRFAFEYLFLIQLNNLLTRSKLSKSKAPKLTLSAKELNSLIKSLPFELTKDQDNTLAEILSDISKTRPMNRLIQGDVGSGKTVIAAIASIISAQNGYQSVFMAPTEVLARQHYQTMIEMFPNLDCGIALLTGSEARVFYEHEMEEKKTKASLKKLIESDQIKIIIGTHSLIAKSSKTKALKFPKLGLAVIDEQHRFGVEQRAALTSYKGKGSFPHFLSMSATPIPRTLTLTVFGDLDLSTINELPKGRKAVITKIVDPVNRGKAYNFIRQNVENGRQIFFILPRIEKSDANKETTWSNVKTVKEEFEFLSKSIFKEFKLDMLHGKMKSKEKEQVMAEFKEGKTDILVSTSVIEVGVDIPNASVMVIEGAERFGLSQLYQFRGRVGRGQHQSFCLLFTDSHTDTSHHRLEALVKAKNGFELAEKDLKMRGPGQFLGDKQTGMPDLAMDALTDIQLVKKAQDSAKLLLKTDPDLKKHPDLRAKLIATYKRIHLE